MVVSTLLLSSVMVLSSCNWGEFDDLKKDAWVQLVERDDSGATGDFGIEVTSIPLPAGETGVRFVVSAGDPVGLSQATFNPAGESSNVLGFDASLGGSGQLTPLQRMSNYIPTALAAYEGTDFVVGLPQQALVARLETGLKNGVAILSTTSLTRAGDALAVGKLIASSAHPDIAVMSTSFLTVVPAGVGSSAVSCAMSPPTKSNSPVVPLENVKIAHIDGAAGIDQIVVSGLDADNATPRIFILDAAQVQGAGGGSCPIAASFAVDSPPPGSVQVADVDKDGTPDIVAGSLGAGGADGKVTVYFGVTRTGFASKMDIPSVDADNSSGLRGTRIRVAEVDGKAAKVEIIVGDAGASPNGVSSAGQVQIYNFGTDGCAAPATVRGGFCLVTTLFDSDPGKDKFFGRALAIGSFNSKSILAVTQKNMLLVYFQLLAGMTDTRMK